MKPLFIYAFISDENIRIISFSGNNSLRVFVNKVPRKMNGPKREKVQRRMY